jgi:hypothetical protein
MAQVVERLPSKHKALNSSPNNTKNWGEIFVSLKCQNKKKIARMVL